MKVLTVHQPWATLIIVGAKPWEFRGRPLPRPYIDRRIGIHASKRPVMMDEVEDLERRLYDQRDPSTGLDANLARQVLVDARVGKLPIAAVLGTVKLGEAIEAKLISELGDSDRMKHHQWGWPVSEPDQWAQPVTARGAQGFWTFPRSADADSAQVQF